MGDHSGVTNTIPVVDLGEADEAKLVKAIAEAARKWGFFQAVNHSVPAAAIASLQAAGAEFFGLSAAEKWAHARAPERGSIEGYGAKLGDKRRAAWGEHLFHKIWPPSQIDYGFWPQKPDSYRGATEEYGRHVREAVAEKVLKCLSLGLGLEGHVLKEALGGDEMVYMMKINYYPPANNNNDDDNDNNNNNNKDGTNLPQLGVPAHTDMSSLTILVPNQVPGLQILNDDHLWIDVDYIPNALVIHIGDQIQIASNGYYKSVMHRSTVDKEKTRMSWPLFLEPPADFVVGPIPQLLQVNYHNATPPRYNPMAFKDYAFAKLTTPTTKLINIPN